MRIGQSWPVALRSTGPSWHPLPQLSAVLLLFMRGSEHGCGPHGDLAHHFHALYCHPPPPPRAAEGSLWTLGDGTGMMSLPLTLLPWPCADRDVRIQKVFNGYLRVTNENFLDAYENPNSTEFVELASKVKEAVSPRPGLEPVLAVSPWAGVGHGRAPGPRREGGSGLGWGQRYWPH